MTTLIAIVSLLMSFTCFGIYVYVVLFRQPKEEERGFRQEGEIEAVAKLAEALAKLVDAMGKAGPSALSLFGAMVFMVVALIAARP